MPLSGSLEKKNIQEKICEDDNMIECELSCNGTDVWIWGLGVPGAGIIWMER